MSKNAYFILGIVLLVILLFIGIKLSGNRQSGFAPIRTDITVVAFGDSLVFGYGSGEGGGFVSVLSKRLDLPIVNAGKNGDTTESAAVRLQTDVLDKNPGVVLLLLGGNDALRRLPAAQTFANLSSMIDKIQAGGAKVLLLGIRGGLLGDSYEGRFEKLAKEKKVEYVPNVLSGLLTDSKVMFDAIHPNDAGYEKIADKVEPVLRKMLQK